MAEGYGVRVKEEGSRLRSGGGGERNERIRMKWGRWECGLRAVG